MNKQALRHSSRKLPLTTRHLNQNTDFQPQKFTPASRSARIKSWHQRMQGIFSRQSY